VLKSHRSHELEELQMFGVWRCKLPSFHDHVLAVLFAEFSTLSELFDPTETARALCTLENLTALVKRCGATTVARRESGVRESGVRS
jgi:hypothetical protein